MNSTALGARKITFISEAHEKSYYEKLEFFQFSQKAKFDPEHIGTMYMNTIRANSSNLTKKQICLDLKALYDATKKYHHGAEDGSLLGISWVNPNEVEYFDEVLQKIVTDIRTNGMVRELSA